MPYAVIAQRLQKTWRRFSSFPGGRWLFSRALGVWVPYSGSIKADIRVLEPGKACVVLPDRRRVRNHLGSVHAIALANVGEMVTGLALMAGLPENGRLILVGLDVQYGKKARGPLTASCACTLPERAEERDCVLESTIQNAHGDVVATVRATWRLGIEPSGKGH